MTQIVKFLLGFLLIFGGLSVSKVSFAQEPMSETSKVTIDSLPNHHIVGYKVYGMDCPGCHSAIEKQLLKIDGVLKVTASWKKQEVIITVDSGKTVSEKQIFERIKKANFTPGEKIILSEEDKQ